MGLRLGLSVGAKEMGAGVGELVGWNVGDNVVGLNVGDAVVGVSVVGMAVCG